MHWRKKWTQKATFALEGPAEQRTKMVLARSLQRHGEALPGETLQSLWHLTSKSSEAEQQVRSMFLFAPPVGVAAPAPLAGRGRGRGSSRPSTGGYNQLVNQETYKSQKSHKTHKTSKKNIKIENV